MKWPSTSFADPFGLYLDLHQKVTHFSCGSATNKQARGVIKRERPPFEMQGFEGGSAPSPPSGFLRLVDGRKCPWWIVGSLPHQKKPRLLVFHVSHFKEKCSLLQFKNWQEDWALLRPLPRPIDTHEYH